MRVCVLLLLACTPSGRCLCLYVVCIPVENLCKSLKTVELRFHKSIVKIYSTFAGGRWTRICLGTVPHIMYRKFNVRRKGGSIGGTRGSLESLPSMLVLLLRQRSENTTVRTTNSFPRCGLLIGLAHGAKFCTTQ